MKDDILKEFEQIKKEYQKYYNSFEEKSNELKEKTLKYLKEKFYLDDIKEKEKINKQDVGKIYFVSGILHREIKTKF